MTLQPPYPEGLGKAIAEPSQVLEKETVFSAYPFRFSYKAKQRGAELHISAPSLHTYDHVGSADEIAFIPLLEFLLGFIPDLCDEDLEVLLKAIKAAMPKKRRRRTVELPRIHS